MRIKTNKNILNIVLVCMVLFGAADKLSAINPVRIDTAKAQLVIPRPALESVPTPLVKSASDPIDTLDTVNEFIKVILYADNTWQYYKTPDYQKVTGVFENDWKENVIKFSDVPIFFFNFTRNTDIYRSFYLILNHLKDYITHVFAI